MTKSERPTPEEASLIERAGQHVHRYVQMRWCEDEWETAWFVNPPVSALSAVDVAINGLTRCTLIVREFKVFQDLPTSTFLPGASNILSEHCLRAIKTS